MIRAILFDLDRTLVDRDSAIEELFHTQWRRAHAHGAAEERRTEFVARLLTLDNKGLADKAEMYARIVAEFGLPPALASELEKDFRENYGRSVGTFPDTLGVLARLHTKGFRMGIVTNGTEKVQQAKIESTGLGRFMTAVLISEREGMKKPDAEIFRRALQRLGVDATEAIVVGDNLVADVGGARAAGIFPVWFAAQEPVASASAEAAVRSLTELEHWLDLQRQAHTVELSREG